MFVRNISTMNFSEHKNAGISLMVGCFLMIVTMVLHPVGGDFDHLLRIVTVGIVSHVIAIISLPFVAYGFWGLSDKIGSTFLSKLSFTFMFFGLVAVMFAGAVNGIILMDFVKSYAGSSEETIASLKPIFRLIRSFNHAFDFIFIGAVCISTGMWSISILKTKKLPIWHGWFGIIISAVALTSLMLGFVFVNLHGFRIFIFGWVAWVVAAGLLMTKEGEE